MRRDKDTEEYPARGFDAYNKFVNHFYGNVKNENYVDDLFEINSFLPWGIDIITVNSAGKLTEGAGRGFNVLLLEREAGAVKGLSIAQYILRKENMNDLRESNIQKFMFEDGKWKGV